ncbi:MAG: hypothetical protein KDA61_02960 [Planctomycetales bacterium]|nr:hypothetical protein [Planctomycetales bacterium]
MTTPSIRTAQSIFDGLEENDQRVRYCLKKARLYRWGAIALAGAMFLQLALSYIEHSWLAGVSGTLAGLTSLATLTTASNCTLLAMLRTLELRTSVPPAPEV